MEQSKWPNSLSRKGITVNRIQRPIIRLSDLKQALEDQDWVEESVRSSRGQQTLRANKGRRSQPSQLGRNTEAGED